jgi:hypothetical protein
VYPEDLRRRPIEDAVTHFPKPEIIPPVTKIIFIEKRVGFFEKNQDIASIFLCTFDSPPRRIPKTAESK